MYDIVILGAGTAGMTAAIYASRAGYKVLLLEKEMYGGQIVNTEVVENYPGFQQISGFDYANNLYNQVKNLNVDFEFQDVKSLDELKKYNPKTIILALGARHKKHEKIKDLNGVSYCATCDGPLYKDKIVAVIGGGNTALIDAIFLSKYAKKVYLIHRRDKFKAEQKYIESLNNVEIILNTNVIGCIGNEKIEKLILDNNQEIEVDGVFVAIGITPNTEIVKDIIKLDNNGYIIAGEDCKTNIENIFVAGDCRTKEIRQLVTASSDGAIAALNAIKYMEEKNGNKK